MKKQEHKKGKGCLKVIGVIVALIALLLIWGSSGPSAEVTENIENFFIDNDLGTIENIETTDHGNILQLNFKANNIDYIAYVFNENTDNHKVGDIANIATKFLQFYSIDDNDLVLSDNEKAILINRANYLKLTDGYTNVIPTILKRNLETKINYPETLKIGNVTTQDSGDYFIQEIEFTSENAFGTKIKNYARYKMDFKTNEFELQSIY